MEILTNGSQPSTKGAERNFTGSVRIDMLFRRSEPARVGGGLVTFEPGARTAWHTHPLGQSLIIISGRGWVQKEGGPLTVVNPGDLVWFEPGEKHWHGATSETAMSHFAISESLDGESVHWLEKVSDQQIAQSLTSAKG